ncbi:hypothetical protein [Bradyrhizobium sp. B024]|uniref:hypothetical protein n=1 Tax=Bradyrhizobium sp. B024 TaxID=3140247 RepID=UPI001B70E8E6|nr:hypothetical protein [Bradyrhizobium japonicum]
MSKPSDSSQRKLDWGRNEIERLRGHLRAQEREIRMLQRAGVPTASAELPADAHAGEARRPLPPT